MHSAGGSPASGTIAGNSMDQAVIANAGATTASSPALIVHLHVPDFDDPLLVLGMQHAGLRASGTCARTPIVGPDATPSQTGHLPSARRARHSADITRTGKAERASPTASPRHIRRRVIRRTVLTSVNHRSVEIRSFGRFVGKIRKKSTAKSHPYDRDHSGRLVNLPG